MIHSREESGPVGKGGGRKEVDISVMAANRWARKGGGILDPSQSFFSFFLFWVRRSLESPGSGVGKRRVGDGRVIAMRRELGIHLDLAVERGLAVMQGPDQQLGAGVHCRVYTYFVMMTLSVRNVRMYTVNLKLLSHWSIRPGRGEQPSHRLHSSELREPQTWPKWRCSSLTSG